MIGLKTRGGERCRGYTNKRTAINFSSFIWVDEHENVGRLHNLLCHIRLRPNPAKPSIKKNLNWQQTRLPNLLRTGVESGAWLGGTIIRYSQHQT